MINNKKIFSLTLFFILSLGFVTNAQAFEYGGFGIRPADLESGTVKKDIGNFSYDLNINETKKDGLMVVNNTKFKKTFIVYAADSVSSTDGGFACKQYAEEKTAVGAWVKLEKNEVTLEAGTNEIIPFTITMPANIDAGEHDGCFLVEEKKDSDNSTAKSGIQLSIRTGVKIAIVVPGELIKKINIENFDSTKKGDGRVFNVAVKNEGNVSVDTSVNVVIKNIFGFTTKKLGGNYVVLRDEKSVWNFQLNKLFWGGFHKAKLIVQYNPDPKGNLNTKDKSQLQTLKSEKTIVFFSLPTTQGLITEIAILLFIIFNVYLLSIWKRRQDWIKTWDKYSISKSTNIKVLAEKFEVNWKLLAKVNKIKAPYMIDSKNIILVPNDLEEEYNKQRPSISDKIKNLLNTSKKTTSKNIKKKKKITKKN